MSQGSLENKWNSAQVGVLTVPVESASTYLMAMLKALCDPRRLSIFDMLMEGVQCNCEISERLGVSLSLISYHLRVLSEAGLVQSKRDPEDARWVYYSVNRAALSRAREALDSLLDVGRIRPRVPSCGPRRCGDG